MKNPPPYTLFPTLFHAVQLQRLFADSKVFVDAVPKRSANAIEVDYLLRRQEADFNLSEFVAENFELPVEVDPATAVTGLDAKTYINKLWRQLKRAPDAEREADSLIPLPHSYIVPGGRFREIYYWDSYFTLLGLAASGEWQSVRDMVANFAHLIDTLGHIPNGNRSYYLSRSQPPLFAHMVQLLAAQFPEQQYLERYLPALRREYDFWMQGEDNLSASQSAHRRVVLFKGALLNRYWDDDAQPRQESYAEDIELANSHSGDVRQLYRNLRAACETGWDFSSRWFASPDHLCTVRTTELVPIDLNCIMVTVEQVLAKAYAQVGDKLKAVQIRARADRRAQVIRQYFFCEHRQQFVDCLLPHFSHSDKTSLATSWPLFSRVATADQALQVSKALHIHFLRPGGWVTTERHTGQQWDAPNGWAPLQWVTFQGLINYGFDAQAREGGQRWLDNNLACFQSTGKFFEKYDVEQPGRIAGGGEYPVQHGFGWTNAVFLVIQAWLSKGE